MSKLTYSKALSRAVTQLNIDISKCKYIKSINDNIYLFNYDKGGLILSSTDNTNLILGIVENADFSATLPKHIQLWLEEYSNEIISMQNNTLVINENKNNKSSIIEKTNIAQLIDTKWSQDIPFNSNLTFNNKTCLAGSAAITIAQIMYYWGLKDYKRGCLQNGKYQYLDDEIIPETPSIITFDYDNLTKGFPQTPKQINAVSTLIEYIGKAFLSKYGKTLTYTNIDNIITYLKSKLRMGSNIQCVSWSTLGYTDFANTIYNELANGCPVSIIPNNFICITK